MIPISKLMGRMCNNMFQYAYLYAQVRSGRIPDVYVQNYEYFDMYSDEIKQLFSQGIVKNDYVAIHIRRGDYVDNPVYVDLTKTDYYKKAIAEFPDAKFLIFSDDLQWCRYKWDLFDEKRMTLSCRFEVDYIIEANTELDDLNRMAGCAGVIMANSSFSWWASFLSAGKVIAPKQWFTDGTSIKLLPQWKTI